MIMTLDARWHSRTGNTVLAAICCLALLAGAAPLLAQEDIDEEEPIPASVDEIVSPMDRLVEKKPRRSGIITLAYTTFAKWYDIQNPWSGNPGFTSSMISDFKKAGASAITTRISYDFTRVGLEGVAAYIHFAHGWVMVDKTTKAAKPNENELDAGLQWRPTWRYLQGLWVRGRYCIVHQYEGSKQ